MRAQRIGDYRRSRSPHRMRDRYPPPPPPPPPRPGVGERDYSSSEYRQIRSPPARMRSTPPPRIREREYSPQYREIRERDYSPQYRDVPSPRIRERGYLPQYRDMPSFPSMRDQGREYSPRYHGEVHGRHLPYVPGSGSGSVVVERERSRRFLDGDGEHRNDLVGRRDYDSHGRRGYDSRSDRNSDENLWKRPKFNEDLSQTMFKWRGSLAEPAKSNVDSRPVPLKPGVDYVVGSSRMTSDKDYGVGSSRMTAEKDYEVGNSRMTTEKDYGVGSSRMTSEKVCGERDISDLSRRGGIFLDEKSIPAEDDRVGNFFAHHSGAKVPNSSTHINGSFSLPIDHSTRHLHKDEDLKFRDHSGRQSTKDAYWDKDEPFSYTKDASPYAMQMSHSKTSPIMSSGIPKESFSGFYNDNSCHPTSGFHRDAVGQARPYQSLANHELQRNDMMNYQQVDVPLPVEKTKDRTYLKLQRNETSDSHVPSDEYYENIGNFRENYAEPDSMRSGGMDPSLARISGTSSQRDLRVRESRSWDQHHSFAEHLHLGQLDSNRHSHVNKHDDDILLSRNTYGEFGGEIYQESQSLLGGKHYDVERDVRPWAYEEKFRGSAMVQRDQGFYGYDYNSQGRVTEEELDLHEEKMLERRTYLKDRRSSKRNLGKKLSINKKPSRQQHVISDRNVLSTFGDECIYSSRKTDMPCYYYKTYRRSSNEVSSGSSQLPSHKQQRQVEKSQKIPSRDIKKRLKPSPMGNSLGDKKQKRPLLWMRPPIRKHKPDKSLTTHVVSSDESSHDLKGLSPKAMVDIVKTEPPEGSNDFRLLVHNAFLKFIKQLNENPAHRRKYTEQGNGCILKCSICGSKSEEFADTKGLAMHAFGSTLPGLRSQHLGFHRALCLLMGWNSAAALNASWGCEALPDAEIMAIKEDLIIWPPVVIVHNSSIESSDPAHRFIVNSESLKDYLRDHGFEGGNAKVCHGKPANLSILVVTFSGTFSGLQEAERLHKFYAENKHGRAELQEGHGAATQAVVGDKVKDVLYGFLGLAGDLDKLEFETKKRCVVRSKKDIQAIADAPINMDSINP